ncbi:MAG: G-D-S-L family lipolytic protein [Flavobacteriaceae bacterium]|nr:G-D-S-L family lipolytic protein [Flavobacteriaceae bacterium]
MNHKYFPIWLLALLLGFSACSGDDDGATIIEEEVVASPGSADFSNYVSIGNSLTAGFADGALFVQGQENSFPKILSEQFKLAGGGEFTIPLMNDNLGGMLAGGQQILPNRLALAQTPNGLLPQVISGSPTTEATNVLAGPFNNMGVPGAKSFHVVTPGFGNPANISLGRANPYFVRMASSPNATVFADALAQNPTFFSLWLGNNDVLSFALSGGTGVDQTGNLDPSTYGANDITDPTVFASVYNTLLTSLTANGAKGVVANIPDVFTIPFFTTIPNNALVLDASQAAGLTGFFQAFTGIFTQALILQNVPAQQAVALASQYAFTFTEGPNRFLISVPATQTNPLGLRQMTPDELLVLTIDQNALRNQGYGSVAITPDVLQVLGLLQGGGTPTPQQAQLVLNAVNPIADKDALDSDELTMISNAASQYNATIAALAQQFDLALVDAKSLQLQVLNGGIPFEGGILRQPLVTGGAFSLDGVHPSQRGYAAIANEFIKAINAKYGATLPLVNLIDFNTLFLP